MPFLSKSLSTIAAINPAVMNAEKTNMKPIPRMWMLYRFLFILQTMCWGRVTLFESLRWEGAQVPGCAGGGYLYLRV